MANVTVHQLTELAEAPATNDELPIWDSSASQYKRITIANHITRFITGAGVLATGGFTLTVPATGTAALLETAQTFSALKIFSAGINLGNTNLTMYQESTWTPAIQGSGGNPTVSYTLQVGKYTRIGNIVFFTFAITIGTISGGSGDIRITLPVAAANITGSGTVTPVRVDGVNLTGTPATVVFSPIANQSYGVIRTSVDDAAGTNEPISALANGDTIVASGFYFTS